jgi:hypothetical protein
MTGQGGKIKARAFQASNPHQNGKNGGKYAKNRSGFRQNALSCLDRLG